MGKRSGGGGNGASFISNCIGLIGSFFSTGASAVSAIQSIVSAIFYIAIALVLVFLMIPWSYYHDTIIEEGEHMWRTALWPFYRDIGQPVLEFVQELYDPTICYIDGGSVIANNMITDVLIPTIQDCVEFKTLFIAVKNFVLAVLKEFIINYVFKQAFYNGAMDFTNICNKWIVLWNLWTQVYRCACSDFGQFLYDLPVIPSVPFSAQWADPQLWCFIGNTINAAFEAFTIVLKLVIQVLQALLSLIAPHSPFAQVNFTRPDFSHAAELACIGLSCLARSMETAVQRFWDNYIPFDFNFDQYFSPFDTIGCLGLKTANWVLTLIAHIDQVVLYPSNTFWEAKMKPLLVENINLFAAPTRWAPVLAPGPPAPR